MRIGRQSSLHPNLDGFKGTEKDIGKELGAGGRGQVEDGLVGAREEAFAVEILEDLVEAVFPTALTGIAD